MSLFVKKSIPDLLEETQQSGKGSLKRTLNATSLIALGVGVMVGAGIFSITGMAAANYAGPGIMISFIIAAVGCGLAGLCYAEFASMIPVAGSAYTYSYATMGEFIAWIIGWDLVLEYTVGAATVASSWSDYFVDVLDKSGISFPVELTMTRFEQVILEDGTVIQGILNLPAVFIVVLMSVFLIRGTNASVWLNNFLVVLKIAIIVIFIVIGFKYIRPENLSPLVPANTGKFGEYGFSGVIRAAAIVFFAFLGFDAISTAAQETKNPKRNMPIGIIGSILITTVLYIFFAYVLTGVADYTVYKEQGTKLAPVAKAVEWMGPMVNGVVPQPDFPWLNTAIVIAILFGFSSVILVMLLAQSRIFYTMSRDGLLPKVFSKMHRKNGTPYKSNLIFMVVVSIFASSLPGNIVGEMVSIGTLFAFVLVCLGVIVARYKLKDVPRGFRVPWVPVVPILGVLVCLGMMLFLPFDTWIRLLVWLLFGLDIYERYGIKKSKLNKGNKHIRDRRVIDISGMVISFILIALAIIHDKTIDPLEKNDVFFWFSVGVGLIHFVYFAVRFTQNKRKLS